jgi:preprotein translocase subunit SecE
MEKIKSYMAEVSKEMKKVSWPTKEQLKESTIVTIVACIVITLFTYVIDIIMSGVVDAMFL